MVNVAGVMLLQAGHELVLLCESDPGAQQVLDQWGSVSVGQCGQAALVETAHIAPPPCTESQFRDGALCSNPTLKPNSKGW